MFHFHSLKTYFSFVFLLLFVTLLCGGLFLVYSSFHSQYSDYQQDLDNRISASISQLDSRSSERETGLLLTTVLEGFPELISLRYEDMVIDRTPLSATLNPFFSIFLGVSPDSISEIAYNDKGISVAYAYQPHVFVVYWTPLLYRYLFWLGLTLFVLAYLFAVMLAVVRPIVKVRNAALHAAKGEMDKPVSISGKNELATIGTFFNEVVSGLKSVSSDLEDRDRLKAELGLAAKIQGNLIPTEAPVVSGLDINVKTRSAVEVGGDVLDFIHTEHGHLLFFIGDATGHGVPAGLVMSMTDVLVHSMYGGHSNLKDLVAKMNTVLYSRTDKTMFITYVIFDYDEASGVFSYCGAGHEQILVYRAATQSLEIITPGGVAAGMFPDVSNFISPGTITLNEGDTLMLFTDGLVEARNSAGELYGLDRASASFRTASTRDTSSKIMNFITEDFREFIDWEGYFQEDDISIIVIRKTRSGEQVGANLTLDGARTTKWTWEKDT